MCRILFFILTLTCSCRSTRLQHISDSKEPTIYKGIIHMNENGCPYYIEITNCYVSHLAYYIGKKVYPVELEEKYKKEGLEIQFDLYLSKAPSPTDCQIDYVVSLEKISVVTK